MEAYCCERQTQRRVVHFDGNLFFMCVGNDRYFLEAISRENEIWPAIRFTFHSHRHFDNEK